MSSVCGSSGFADADRSACGSRRRRGNVDPLAIAAVAILRGQPRGAVLRSHGPVKSTPGRSRANTSRSGSRAASELVGASRRALNQGLSSAEREAAHSRAGDSSWRCAAGRRAARDGGAPDRRCEAIAAMAGEGLPVQVAERVFDVSGSGHHDFRNRGPSPPKGAHARLTDVIRAVHLALARHLRLPPLHAELTLDRWWPSARHGPSTPAVHPTARSAAPSRECRSTPGASPTGPKDSGCCLDGRGRGLLRQFHARSVLVGMQVELLDRQRWRNRIEPANASSTSRSGTTAAGDTVRWAGCHRWSSSPTRCRVVASRTCLRRFWASPTC